MTSITVEYPWPAFLEQMVEGLARQLAAARPDLALVDVHGDQDQSLLTAELPGPLPDRADAAWKTAVVVSQLWTEWLGAHRVDCLVDTGGLRVTTPCTVMVELANGRLDRAGWLAASTVEISPARQ